MDSKRARLGGCCVAQASMIKKGIRIITMLIPFSFKMYKAIFISSFSDGTWRRLSVLFWVYIFC